MMKRSVYILLCSLAACTSFGENPYADDLRSLRVEVVYPEGYEHFMREGVGVVLQDKNNATSHTARTDAQGVAEFRVTSGQYRIAVTDIVSDDEMFNGMLNPLNLVADTRTRVELSFARRAELVIREIYCGGCPSPDNAGYAFDKYVILHNNKEQTVYLDGLCFGFADPYNSSGGANVWVTQDPVTGQTVFPGFVPVLEAVWEFGGGGTDFPLEPGGDAIIAVNGAVDHTKTYPASVDLNREECFVCYAENEYTNVKYHPAPGDRIQPSRILRLAVKLGRGTGYGFSQSSPAVLIFRPQGTSLGEFLEDPKHVVQKPGSANDKCALVPEQWVIDAVEVFTSPADKVKRFPAALDGGYVVLSTTKQGHALQRKINEGATAALGFEVLLDTNNSENDLVETEKASLHESL